MAVIAKYFDGETARDWDVELGREGSYIVFQGADVPVHRWSISGLHSIDPPDPGHPFRISHASHPGKRLIVRDEAFITSLVDDAPQLRGGYSIRHFGHVFGWTAAGLAGLALVGYVLLSILPGTVAPYLPESWREKTGKQIEASVVEGYLACKSEAGVSALGKMIGNLANNNDLPALSVRVYKVPIMNAFAVSGGRIIMTEELLNAADNPDEIAGVLAHEVGHVYHYHPEAQLVRITGLQVLVSAFGGSGSSDIVTNAAALATLFRYSRNAEREADAFARVALQNAQINPLGFKTFFEKIFKIENKGGTPEKPKNPALDALGTVFSTHPDTEARIKEIQPLPAGVTPVPSLTAQEWKDLKNICSKT